MTLTVRTLTPADLAAADAVVTDAFASTFSREPEIRRLLALQSDGWLLAELDGAPAGAVAAVCYGPFAYVGLMSVRRELHRRGIGLALMERLLELIAGKGCPTALLDATEMGHPLYLRLGFVEESRTLQFVHDAPVPRPLPHGVEPFGPAEIAEVAAFDALRFGADRAAVIAAYAAEGAGTPGGQARSFLVRDVEGRVCGYLVARGSTLGPWVATDPDAARLLLEAALVHEYPDGLLVNVPAENAAACDLLQAHGFEQRRRELQYGLASFATG